MANNVYIGNRYVPVFADPVEWDSLREYEPLTIVTYHGTAYTSRQTVPVGTALNNTAYWVVTGNYNAQVEQYRQEVQTLSGDVSTLSGNVSTLSGNVSTLSGNVSSLSGDVNTLSGDVSDLEDDLDARTNNDVIVIGDSGNDLSMFEQAKLKIAMANADEELKKNADYITDTNNNDGVAKAIKKFIY